MLVIPVGLLSTNGNCNTPIGITIGTNNISIVFALGIHNTAIGITKGN